MPSWKKVIISGSDASLNTLNVSTALTASGLNYPTADGSNGQAIVTDGSGSLSFASIITGTGATTKLLQTTPSDTWTFNHNLSEKYPVITIYDDNDKVIVPLNIEALNSGSVEVTFSTARTGTAVAVVGGSTESSSYALTASYVNPLRQEVQITGSLEVLGSVTATEFHTQLVSSSILYQSGSTKFGDTSDDTHQITGSLYLTGSTVNLNVAWPEVGVENHLIETNPFTVSSSYGERTYEYAAFAMEHYNDIEQGLDYNAFRLYMYDQDDSPSYGTTFLLGPYRSHISIGASGSNSFANLSVSDLGNGRTLALVYGTQVEFGVYNTETILLGNTTSSLEINSSGTEHTGSFSLEGTLNIKSANVSYQENLDVDSAATEVIATVSATEYTAAFFDYVIKNGTNVRAGTVIVTHDGTSVEYVDTSTQDLGNTSGVVLSGDLSGGNIRLLASTTADDWSIKTLVRAI